ncbi:MAG: hypothetical protein Q4G42_00290 [Neisseria sp.]|nr:hypothetical protein [Neisseria sp.]
MQHLYCVVVEVTHMPDTQLPPDCAGAVVRVYLASDDIRQAIDAAERALLEDRYRPLMTLEAMMLDLDDYTDYDEAEEDEHIPARDDLLQLAETGDVWYSVFYTYPPEENSRLH